MSDWQIGDKGVCVFKLVNWKNQPYFGQPVTITGINSMGELFVEFLTNDDEYRGGEHQFHAELIVTEAEWDLIRSTRGLR